MFFILSKVISIFLSPLIWVILLFLCWLIWRSKTFIIGAFSLLLIFSNPYIFKCVINWWESPIGELPCLDNPPKTVVVLGGYASYNDEFHRIRFQKSSDRLMQALLILKTNNLKQLVLTGGSANVLIKERAESVIVHEFLTEVGFVNCEIFIDSISRNTNENAVETAKLFINHNLDKDIYLVTSAWHMKRAMGCFMKQGFEVTPISADPMASIEQASFNDYIVPSAGTLIEWEMLMKEWMGIAIYKVQGYL